MASRSSHFLALSAVIKIYKFENAAAASLIASALGIIVSFISNSLIVFSHKQTHFQFQAIKFIMLYLFIALTHSSVLYLWTDKLVFNYQSVFLIAVSIQFFLGYFVCKQLIFENTHE